MVNDGDPRRGLVGHLGQVGSLNPSLGVLQRIQVARRQCRNGLGTHHHSGVLDDPEHLRDAVVAVADQPSLRRDSVLAEGQFAGGRNLQAHLVFQSGDEHPVALARFAGLGVEQEFGHHKQAQTLGARSSTFGPGQRQVQDVLEDVVAVATGDEPLDAVDVPGAVALVDRFGPAGADVGPGVGFGEHHRRAPVAIDRERCPMLLLLIADPVEDVRHKRPGHVHEHGGVGAEHQLVDRPLHHRRRGYTADGFFEPDAEPFAFSPRAQ